MDILSILPYYITLNDNKVSASSTIFLRMLRVFKVLKILRGADRLASIRTMLKLIIKTMWKSHEALGVIAGVILVTMVLLGTIIYLLEKGRFVVNSTYPQGLFNC